MINNFLIKMKYYLKEELANKGDIFDDEEFFD